MVETHWGDVSGTELRYDDHPWEFTGDVDVRQGGELLAVEATRADGVRHETALLYFGLRDPPGSLNPGDLGEHFDRVERRGGTKYLVVKREPNTYRYALQRIEYE